MTDASIRSERRDNFPTDSDIALDSSEDRQHSRRLQKWSEGQEVQNKTAFGSLDEQNSNSNWTPQAMFEHHEKKYNFKYVFQIPKCHLFLDSVSVNNALFELKCVST